MSLLPRTLTARLVATAVALVAVVSILVALGATVAMNRYLTGQLDDEVRKAATRAAEPPHPGPSFGHDGDRDFGPQGPGTIVAVLAPDDRYAMLISDDGSYRTLPNRAVTDLEALPADRSGHTVRLPTGTYRVMSVRNREGERLVVGRSTRALHNATRSLLLLSSLLALAGIGLAALLGRLLVSRQLRPLRAVAATAHAVTTEELSTGDPTITQRVSEADTDPDTEVGQVGFALNTLLDHVDNALAERHRSEQQVRQFVADASHELRTPLTTIHGYAELSRRSPGDAAALASALDKVEVEASRMSALVEDLLLLARLDAGRPLERELVDVTHLLLEAVADARVVSPDHKWRLDLPDQPVTVTGDEHRLHQAVTNLLNNARSHTPAGTTVTVGAHETPTGVRIVVADDGPGLARDLVPDVFERFTRGDSSRTRTSGGAGLGLSLVSAIAAAHGGRASVTSEAGDTRFTLTLPR